MITRHLKKWLPKANGLTQDSSLSRLQDYLLNPLLWHVNRRSIARGVAIGLLVAFLPLPLQMLVAAILAIFFTANLPIAIALTWITNPFTFLPINYFIYKVGELIIRDGSTYQTINFQFFSQSWQNITQQLLQWIQHAGKPFLVGLPIVAISASIVGYMLIQVIWRLVVYWDLHKRKKRAKKNPSREN